MGRRDEPQLDELTKLLKRLETMEVAPRHDDSKNGPEPESEPEPVEYVGALRGAAHGIGPDARRKTSSEQAASDELSPAAGAGHSTGTTAIVIGATTAAVVSTVVAVGLMLWASDGRQAKNDDERRLTFYAPAEPGTGTRSPATNAQPVRREPAPARRAEPLLQRADAYLRNGQPGEARAVLEQAARLGSGIAALTLGAMYDPARATQFTNLELKADPTMARAWYERARDLGIPEANDRLAELGAR